MKKTVIIKRLQQKFEALLNDLDERGRRRWAAVEAQALGWGGITLVAQATGLSDRTIRTGLRELRDPQALSSDRQRRPGGGRKRATAEQPELLRALDRLVEPLTRGSPTNPLRWTCKSTRRLAAELETQGFTVSVSLLRRLLRQLGYSLQANRKTREGKQHPDRDGQFQHIHRRLLAYRRRRQPAVSVDTKKKEVLGPLKNAGRTWEPKGQPREVNTHDFPDAKRGKAIPYGVFDVAENEALVSVGITHDPAEFAVEALRQWWQQLGRPRYRQARRVLITADSGGSNAPRTRLWKLELQQLADETGLIIEVCHYPPGTSKWNQIEHRLFCHITRNWQGQPLETVEIVVESINATTTATGLEVHAWLDEGRYEKGRKVSDEELARCRIKRHKYHGEWNYEIHPRS